MDDDESVQFTSADHGDAARPLLILAESKTAEAVIQTHVSHLVTSAPASQHSCFTTSDDGLSAIDVGVAALNVFLQANVTGPTLSSELVACIERRFAGAHKDARSSTQAALGGLRNACLKHLSVDGVAPYAYIPLIELFSLARHILVEADGPRALGHPGASSEKGIVGVGASEGIDVGASEGNAMWRRLRLHVWHYKLLMQPSLGPGSNFTKSSQWSDVPTLAITILNHISLLMHPMMRKGSLWSRRERVQFLVEAANNYIMLGRHEAARTALAAARDMSGFMYALSGALGKKTKFQDKSTSQLVVLARGSGDQEDCEPDQAPKDGVEARAKPAALQLNDDTLLEDIAFSKDSGIETSSDALPAALMHLSPDSQPQLSPLDQTILLTEATLRDAFSPLDALTLEETLPFATRVLADRSTNWQIYTQALLLRSRIEIHRSRTLERGVLQLQALADQVIVDTWSSWQEHLDASSVPAITVTSAEHHVAHVNTQVATSFLPAAKASESAPANVRLRYIDALCTPPRWHLESELAYAWAGVGSLVSALEIFKRLRLWAEVALCYASAAAAEDADGRGSGGEEKAKAIIRWRLFHSTRDVPDGEDIDDVSLLKASDYLGPERHPPPDNAPRLWCILGDLENDASHYTRAWQVSQQRYARAPKSLGEYYLQQGDWPRALAAYKLATGVNRLNPDLWCRLGDINLRLGNFEEAAEAYNRAISNATDMAGGEDARTWSNLGSALWSLYKTAEQGKNSDGDDDDGDDDDGHDAATEKQPDDGAALLSQSLAAYKKGASIAHDNWRIWDNVLTIASRIHPAPVADIVLALQHILRIRRSEDAIDASLLSALVQDAVLSHDKDEPSGAASAVYELPRGSPARLVTHLVEDHVVPLITCRSDLWALVARLRGWRRDYAGAIDASERAWRVASATASTDWTTDEAAWADVVKRTDELVSAFENWGPRVEHLGPRWLAKARSAVRSIMGRARDNWQDSDGWMTLQNIMDSLKE